MSTAHPTCNGTDNRNNGTDNPNNATDNRSSGTAHLRPRQEHWGSAALRRAIEASQFPSVCAGRRYLFFHLGFGVG
jgi:hypothetical protein